MPAACSKDQYYSRVVPDITSASSIPTPPLLEPHQQVGEGTGCSQCAQRPCVSPVLSPPHKALIGEHPHPCSICFPMLSRSGVCHTGTNAFALAPNSVACSYPWPALAEPFLRVVYKPSSSVSPHGSYCRQLPPARF